MSAVPERAIVLAAGLGTRMRPLTQSLPKPLLPLWNRPLLFRVLDALQSWGVRDVLINLHHQPRPIRDAVRAGSWDGVRIRFSYEPEILGTGGVLTRARRFVEQGPFWMVNADIAFRLDPARLIQRFEDQRPLAACWLTDERGPRTVDMTRGWIHNFRSARPATPGTYTFCGLQLIDPRILRYLPRRERFTTIVQTYEQGMQAGERVAGVELPRSWWADLGTPAQYLEAHADCAPSRGAWRAVADDVQIHPAAQVRRSVLWSGARIERGARLDGAIVGQGCRVSGTVKGIVMRVADALEPIEQRVLARAGWTGHALAMPLGARGSARVFTRIRNAKHSAILIRHDGSRPENALYAGHARFLARHGFPVPRVLAEQRRRGITVLEDLGDESIQAKLRGAPARVLRAAYRPVLDAVLVLHGAASAAARRDQLAMVPAFRPTLYRWEREYFAEQMLQKRLGLSSAEIARISRELEQLGDRLYRLPRVVVHRDLQSSNVLLHQGRPWFIDFQGMRWGPAVYDLASLIADPYMELPEALQRELLEHYASRSADPARIRTEFWAAAVQRLAQALGAFAKLGANRDTSAFAGYIQPGWRMMQRALGHLEGFPALRARVAREVCKG